MKPQPTIKTVGGTGLSPVIAEVYEENRVTIGPERFVSATPWPPSWSGVFVLCGLDDHIRWSFHEPHMHPGKVLAHDAEDEKLHTGKDRDDRGKEGESWYGIAGDQVACDHSDDDHTAEDGEDKTDHAGDAQWTVAEPGDHVES